MKRYAFIYGLILLLSCNANECDDFEIAGTWILTKRCDSIGVNCNLSDHPFPAIWQFNTDGTFKYTPYDQEARPGIYMLTVDSLIVTYLDHSPPIVVKAAFHLIDGCTFIYDPTCIEVCMFMFEKELS